MIFHFDGCHIIFSVIRHQSMANCLPTYCITVSLMQTLPDLVEFRNKSCTWLSFENAYSTSAVSLHVVMVRMCAWACVGVFGHNYHVDGTNKCVQLKSYVKKIQIKGKT